MAFFKLHSKHELNILTTGAMDDLERCKQKMLNDIALLAAKNGGIIDTTNEDFKTLKNSFFNTIKKPGSEAAVISFAETIRSTHESIDKAIKKGASPDSFKDLNLKMEKFRDDIKSKLESKKGLDELMVKWYEKQSLGQLGFLKNKNEFLNQREKEALVNKLLPHINFPIKDLKKFMSNSNTIVKDIGPIVQTEARKFFAKQPDTEIMPIFDKKKLTKTNVEKFNIALNNAIISYEQGKIGISSTPKDNSKMPAQKDEKKPSKTNAKMLAILSQAFVKYEQKTKNKPDKRMNVILSQASVEYEQRMGKKSKPVVEKNATKKGVSQPNSSTSQSNSATNIQESLKKLAKPGATIYFPTKARRPSSKLR